MTRKQKRIIAVLAIANVAIILTLVGLLTHPTGTPTSSSSPPPSQPACQAAPHLTVIQQATHLLAQAGLGGMVTLTPSGSLSFDIVAPDEMGRAVATSETASGVDDAAQSVWTAFDIALTLNDMEGAPKDDACLAFAQVEVTILVRSRQTDTQIEAKVSLPDLVAYDAGELSESEFIERVIYNVNVVRDS